MKKPKKIDQELLDLEAKRHDAVDKMFRHGFSKKSVQEYQDAVSAESNYQQKKKNSKLAKSYIPVVDEYQIIK